MDCRHDGQAIWTGSGPTAGAGIRKLIKFGWNRESKIKAIRNMLNWY